MADRPWAFVTATKPEELKKGLRAIRDNLTPAEIRSVLESSGELKQNEPEKTTWYRRLDNQSTMRKVLAWLDARAVRAGYVLQVLWTRLEAKRSYEALVETIQVTGAFDDGYRKALGLADEANAELILAAWTLSRQVNADGWTLYGWDHGRNRPVLISHENLYYPEAVEGTCWIDGLVRRSLLQDETDAPVLLVDDAEAREGAFREREGVSRAWKVHLRAPRTRGLLLLNWRREGDRPPEPSSRRYPGFVAPMPRTLPRPERLPAARGLDDPRDLFLAVRYVNGWLAERDVAVTVPPHRKNRVPIDFVLGVIAASFEPWLREEKTSEHPDLSLERFGNLKVAFRSILEPQVFALPEIASCSPDGGSLALPAKFVEEFTNRDGEPLRHANVALGALANGTLPDGSSLLAQSAAWKTSILIREIGSRKRRAEATVPAARRSLLDIRLWPKEAKRRASELIVPVIVGDKPIGAFSVEHSGHESVGLDHLAWVEIVSFIVSGLFDICRRRDAVAERSVLVDFLYRSGRPRDGDALLYRFSEWVATQTGADLVHVLTYDGEKSVFQPRGVHPSERLRERLRDRLLLSDANDARLIGKALESQLTPRRRGRSWDIFRENRTRDIDDLDRQRRNGAYFTDFVGQSFESMYGLPFSCHENAAPDGVIWIGFAKGTARDDLGKSRLEAAATAAIQRVSRIVASAYAAYRYDAQDPNVERA